MKHVKDPRPTKSEQGKAIGWKQDQFAVCVRTVNRGAQSAPVAAGGAHLRTGAAVIKIPPRAVVVPARQRAEAVGVGVAVTFPEIAQVG